MVSDTNSLEADDPESTTNISIIILGGLVRSFGGFSLITGYLANTRMQPLPCPTYKAIPLLHITYTVDDTFLQSIPFGAACMSAFAFEPSVSFKRKAKKIVKYSWTKLNLGDKID